MKHTVKEQREVKQRAVINAWMAACKHDNINPSAKFPVFSDGNPHVVEYDKAARELHEFDKLMDKSVPV